MQFSSADQLHPLNNGYACVMRIDGEAYCSVEQYMMVCKARMFDPEMVPRVLATQDYAEIKALGRQVRNFDPVAWSAASTDVVKRACRAKCYQSSAAMASLLASGDGPIEQLSETDAIWSAPGENRLGVLLAEVRAEVWSHVLY